ncbi:hypothetical protein [Caldimonas brevitalea]|uniref:Uncharacterized protein n=1 Tax=Caldimonas brevitalea TaxID=413882 RepID=A0A0G3BKA9_9BURK|nr:hypothetical protein [Caldimonas brevitalea]AKJ29812.1 hypothetical protein AAW51_3121 [Caldimonas brevitalea]
MQTHKPARFLVLIESGGPMVARLFDAQKVQLTEIDATSEEVAVMTSGVMPRRASDDPGWAAALQGHSAQERQAALVFDLNP